MKESLEVEVVELDLSDLELHEDEFGEEAEVTLDLKGDDNE